MLESVEALFTSFFSFLTPLKEQVTMGIWMLVVA